MRCFLVCLFVIPFISCLTPDEETMKWLLDYYKTNSEKIFFIDEESESNVNPTAVQAAPNLNPNSGGERPNFNPTSGGKRPNLNPTSGGKSPYLNPNGGQKRPNLNPSGGQGQTSRPRGPNLNPSQDKTYRQPTTYGWSNIEISPFQPKESGLRPVNITSSLYGEFPFMVAVLLFFLALCLLVLGTQADFEEDNAWVNGIFTQKPNFRPSVPKGSCTTVNGGVGRCVKPHQCMEDRGEIDLEKLGVLRALGCHYLKVCCPLDQVNTSTTIPKSYPEKRPGCGWSNPGAYTFRSANNRHADFGEFPWMVALIKKTGYNKAWIQSDYLGGGTLIHPAVVLTIAHKVKTINNDPSQLKCRLGEWDTQTTDEIYPHQDRDTKKIIVHEQFSSKLAANDVALVILESPFDMSYPHVGIACLAKSLPQQGTECFSMGWGQDDFNRKDKYAVSLKKIPLPLVARDSCEYSLQNTFLGSTFRLHNSLICAGGKVGFDTCKGDGGSPLVCKISAPEEAVRYSVIGMVSFGIDCGTEVPGVYVNVPHLFQWIMGKCSEEYPELPFLE